MPRYSRLPGPGRIVSTVCRPIGRWDRIVLLVRNPRPLKPVSAVTCPNRGVRTDVTYRVPPSHVRPSAVCRPETAWTGVMPGLRTYQTPSEASGPPAPDVIHIPPAGSKAMFVGVPTPRATVA